MGSAPSSPEDKARRVRSDLIDAELKKDEQLSRNIIKLLLLGAGESGKSTILKQMRILHNNGFTAKEYEQQRGIIRSNILQSISSIITAMEKLGIPYDNNKNQGYAFVVLSTTSQYDDTAPFAAELEAAIRELWKDNGVKACFSRASEYQLNDSAQYFLDSLDRIVAPNYTPSDDDVVRSRVRTTGILETCFDMKDMKFRIFDVGGQRSERKKWIHCFDNVDAIMFISSLSEYDQTLCEDNETNRMIESLILFEGVCNSPCFIKASVILLLNKKDLFEKKIEKIPLTVAFPNYAGDQNYEECAAYIQRQFYSLNGDPENKQIFSHRSCATDTRQVQFVLDSVLSTIISANIGQTGMS